MASLPSWCSPISPSFALLIFLHLTTTPLHARPQWRISEGSRVNSPVAIRRLSDGDAFWDAGGQHGSCAEELCRTAGGSREESSGNPSLRGFGGRCTCRCPKKTPAFREDLLKCTENINECSLASFVSSAGDENSISTQRIPLIFLPLKGQKIHPSIVIRIDALHGSDSSSSNQMADEEPPKCSVTGAHFLMRNGWVHLSNITMDTIIDHVSQLGINRKDQHGSLLYRESTTPFRIYEEKDKIYLQWLGELNMRELLGGRMVLVHLSCQKQDSPEFVQQCVSFRVSGTISLSQGIREVTFDGQEVTGLDSGAGNSFSSNDRNESNGGSSGLTMSEWVAIAAASLFLGAIYVSSVFLYLHLKNSGKKHDADGKRGKQNGFMCGRMWRRDSSDLDDSNESSSPEGLIKTNPLLLLHECHQHHNRQISHYRQGSGKNGCGNMEEKPSNEDSNDEDPHISSSVPSSPNILKSMLQLDPISSDEDNVANTKVKREFHHSSHRNHQVTSAVIHSCATSSSPIERLPEEDVSIVETPQPPYHLASGSHEPTINRRNEPPDSLPPDITSDDPFVPSLFSSSPEALLAAMMGMDNSGAGDYYGQNRKKLYFNPAYFEPELLQSPPPAAVEFLSKIREVITLARHRMAAKRFSPSLLGIPEVEEEDLYDTMDCKDETPSNIPEPIPPCLKRENSRHSCKAKDNVVQRWLENLQSTSSVRETLPIKVGTEPKKPPLPPAKKKPKAPPAPIANKITSVAEDTKQAMSAVIRELEVRRSVGVTCKWDAKNENGIYEVDSLEKTKKRSIVDTLEVITSNNVAPEVISMEETTSVKLYRLPELLSRADGYSLVSEVYVNDTYNSIGSLGTDVVDAKTKESAEYVALASECDAEETSKETKVAEDCQNSANAKNEVEKLDEETVEEVEVKEVLTIRLEDSPSNHRRNPVQEEEAFEMDTLDRKRADDSVEEESVGSTGALSDECYFMDSLERPLSRIFLRSSGSFRSDSLGKMGNVDKTTNTSSSATDLASILASSPLTRAYGSLREVYEARQRRRREQRRRRSSDAAMSPGYGPMRHSNLSAIPAWRLTRSLPEDEPNFYSYRTDHYGPMTGKTRESPLHLLLSPQATSMEQSHQKQSNDASPTLLQNRRSPRSTPPKLSSPVLTDTLNPINHTTTKRNLIQMSPPPSSIESPTRVGYFKQDGLYTSPFCDDDDEDDDGDSDEDEEENAQDARMSIDSLTRNKSFNSKPKTPSVEKMSMISLLQHLQNQYGLTQNNGTYSVVNRKERKSINNSASKAMRINQELQRELSRVQQKNSTTNGKKSVSSFGRGEEVEGGKVTKRTWRRLIEKREKERVAEEESNREARLGEAERLQSQLRRIAGLDGCLLGKLNSRKELKFRLEDSGYLSSSDESAIGRMSLRKGNDCAILEAELDEADDLKREGDLCSDTEGESVFDGASESGAESIATDSFFGSFRVVSTAAEKAEQQQKQFQRCSALFEMMSGSDVGVNRSKGRQNSEEDGTDSESGGFVKVIRNSQKSSFVKANS